MIIFSLIQFYIYVYICLDIEPRQLEPVEFIVSGSLTDNYNTLQSYGNTYTGGYTNTTTTTATNTTTTTNAATERTLTSRNNTGYNNQTINSVSNNQSYAPYFITSLHDQTIREGQPVLFEIVISGKYSINKSNRFNQLVFI